MHEARTSGVVIAVDNGKNKCGRYRGPHSTTGITLPLRPAESLGAEVSCAVVAGKGSVPRSPAEDERGSRVDPDVSMNNAGPDISLESRPQRALLLSSCTRENEDRIPPGSSGPEA